jgi:hydrogenase maturation factor
MRNSNIIVRDINKNFTFYMYSKLFLSKTKKQNYCIFKETIYFDSENAAKSQIVRFWFLVQVLKSDIHLFLRPGEPVCITSQNKFNDANHVKCSYMIKNKIQ